MSKYINIPLPEELAKQIEKIIQKSDMGYKTKTEFIKEAVREKLIEFIKFREIQMLSDNKKFKTKQF